MAKLLVMIREGRAVNTAASEEMYRVLCNIYWNGEALSQIPPYVQAASKQGAVNASRSEVVLVNAPSGDYVFCIITKSQKDKSWDYDNEGYVLIRMVSKILWNYSSSSSSGGRAQARPQEVREAVLGKSLRDKEAQRSTEKYERPAALRPQVRIMVRRGRKRCIKKNLCCWVCVVCFHVCDVGFGYLVECIGVSCFFFSSVFVWLWGLSPVLLLKEKSCMVGR